MNRGRLINPDLLALIASLGHTETIVIADAGLPIPVGVPRLDLALVRGTPSFLAVLEAVSTELIIESATLALEFREHSPLLHRQALAILPSATNYVNHEEFKRFTAGARLVVRTGESTPFANVILHAGVDF